MAKHPVCFWEINAEDAEPLANFYKNVLEWKISFNHQSGFYSVASGTGKDGGIAGGIFSGKGQLPPHRALYVEVEAVDEVMTRVSLHGGKVALEPYDIAGVGRLAFFRDPEGHMIGLIQRQHKTAQPHAAAAEAGKPEPPTEPQAADEPEAAAGTDEPAPPAE